MRPINIKYGFDEQRGVDITEKCMSFALNGKIFIPPDDVFRAHIFGDPAEGILKKIFVETDNKKIILDHNTVATIDIEDKIVKVINDEEININLSAIHSNLKLHYGKFRSKLHEQKLSVKWLSGKEKILQISRGSGINSLVIALIMKNKIGDSKNLVVFESCPKSAKRLIQNRELNGFNFGVENFAISKSPLFLQKDWEIIKVEDENEIVRLLNYEGYSKVNTTNFQNIKNSYPLNFDTLVVDCQGTFYDILKDFPEILEGIILIIMENDYFDFTKKRYVNSVLENKNFFRIEKITAGWGPCNNEFYEVWHKVKNS